MEGQIDLFCLAFVIIPYELRLARSPGGATLRGHVADDLRFRCRRAEDRPAE